MLCSYTTCRCASNAARPVSSAPCLLWLAYQACIQRTDEVENWNPAAAWNGYKLVNCHAYRWRRGHGQAWDYCRCTCTNVGSNFPHKVWNRKWAIYLLYWFWVSLQRLTSSDQIVIICGRNEKLAQSLSSKSWPLKVAVKVRHFKHVPAVLLSYSPVGVR